MSVEIPNAASDGVGIEVSENVFGRPYNEPLIHQVVVAYLASGRSGTKSQKTRSEVSGGGSKPWKQKGTGRARAGTIRSPLWRTGGVTFAADTRTYQQKLNKKMYRGAMRSIFSELLRQGRLVVSSDLAPAEPKSRLLLDKLKAIGVEKALIITDSQERNLLLAARNLVHVEVCESHSLSPVRLVNSEKVVVTPEAAKKIEAALA